jgi:hypothetical protein
MYTPAKEERRTSIPKVEPYIEKPSNNNVSNDITKRSFNDYDVTPDYGRIGSSKHTHEVTKDRFNVPSNGQQRSWKPEVMQRGKMSLKCQFLLLIVFRTL